MYEAYDVLLNSGYFASFSKEEDHLFLETKKSKSRYKLYDEKRPRLNHHVLCGDANDGSYRDTGDLTFRDVADVYRFFCISMEDGSAVPSKPAPRYDRRTKTWEGEDDYVKLPELEGREDDPLLYMLGWTGHEH